MIVAQLFWHLSSFLIRNNWRLRWVDVMGEAMLETAVHEILSDCLDAVALDRLRMR